MRAEHHVLMVLKLDSLVSVVWRNPFDMQFGVEPTRVILRDVSSAQEQMVAALAAGISESGLEMVADTAGAGPGEAGRLLERLQPVLDRTPPAAHRQFTIAVVGSGPTAARLSRALGQTGNRVVRSASVADVECDLGVAVASYVFDPTVYGFWLRRDVPHLPVIFGDGGATIGPMVEPGSGPCLYCIDRYRVDSDPAWPAIASQLWGRSSPAQTPLLSREVTARATRLVVDRLATGAAEAAASIYLPMATGIPRKRTWRVHPDCGCTGMDTDAGNGISAVTPAPRGNGLPDVAGPDVSPLLPTSVRAASWRG